MTSNGGIPAPVPDVPDDQKFDGGIRVAWKPIERKITVSLKNQGLDGYINGMIKRPVIESSSDSTSTTLKDATPVFSDKPSKPEWTFRNNRAKGIIESFVADLPSLVPEVDDVERRQEIGKAPIGGARLWYPHGHYVLDILPLVAFRASGKSFR
ncbi:hypothetical protein F5050DRAFT_1810883 [Lentinula boryana]|uniref:Uncharacterized protein n=1 Tax=Lentinula boryana TaxID=40481 RepID=A0ABQ8Q3T3_9AGAR|nr:hypothetical protein F5050DRAFT_1810883 [Lentinula boryana]